jgi:hypothetical protein
MSTAKFRKITKGYIKPKGMEDKSDNKKNQKAKVVKVTEENNGY